jgi:hypothetical protein
MPYHNPPPLLLFLVAMIVVTFVTLFEEAARKATTWYRSLGTPRHRMSHDLSGAVLLTNRFLR